MKINAEQIRQLNGLLAQKGRNWSWLCGVAQWPAVRGPEAMSLRAFTWAMQYLQSLPDAPAGNYFKRRHQEKAS